MVLRDGLASGLSWMWCVKMPVRPSSSRKITSLNSVSNAKMSSHCYSDRCSCVISRAHARSICSLRSGGFSSGISMHSSASAMPGASPPFSGAGATHDCGGPPRSTAARRCCAAASLGDLSYVAACDAYASTVPAGTDTAGGRAGAGRTTQPGGRGGREDYCRKEEREAEREKANNAQSMMRAI